MIPVVDAWERYAAAAQQRRPKNAAGATTWLNWTQYPDHGPDESILGDLAGRRVLELGSGSGANLAHLATLGADCIGVDIAPSRTLAAQQAWAHLPNLRFTTADAVAYLAHIDTRFDVVLSIFGAVWFTDPAVLLTSIHARMNPGGIFAFSHLPAAEEQRPPADRLITRWELSAERWIQVLTRAGFTAATACVIPGPVADKRGTLVVQARTA